MKLAFMYMPIFEKLIKYENEFQDMEIEKISSPYIVQVWMNEMMKYSMMITNGNIIRVP